MKKIHSLAFAVLSFALAPSLMSADEISYKISVRSGIVGMSAGVGKFVQHETTEEGSPAIMMQMTMATTGAAHLFYQLNDTMTSIQTPSGRSIRYQKIAHEGKNHSKENARFTYKDGKCHINYHVEAGGNSYDREEEWDETVYDMLSLLGFTRSFNNVEEGAVIKFPMVNGDRAFMQHIVCEGRTKVKDSRRNYYDCLQFSIRDYKGGAERETMKVFVTDDAGHLPVRLEIMLGKSTTAIVVLDKAKN